MENQKPILIVSLDFELFWGVCASRSFSEYQDHILGARAAIPRLLERFRAHSIHATWATVGFLFADGYEEARHFFPPEALLPSYQDAGLSTYRCFSGIGPNEKEAPCFFAPSLIRQISKEPGQEIGSHTFSHFYCRAPGQTVDQFTADLEAASAIAQSKGVRLETLVLPRNQTEPAYTKGLSALGLQAYRGEEQDWIHRRVKLRPLLRLLRLLDVYLPITGQGGYQPKQEDGVWNFPGSRMFKPYFRPLAPFEWLKLRRIKGQMRHAAKHGLVFHLWWHPHNFGVRTEEHLKQLEEVLAYYDRLKDRYGMVSMNMKEAAAYFSAGD